MSIRTRSPIFHLETAIAGCAFNIAPERASKLAILRDARNIILEVTDDTKFRIRVNPQRGNITVPVAAAEYLWSCALLFPTSYQEYTRAQREGLARLDLRESVRFREAEALCNWAFDNMIKSGTGHWPNALPSPESEGEHIKLANELFLCALAWSIHHELAHITLQHELIVPSDVAIKQEKAADLEATRWVLQDLRNDDLRLTKRALGVATGLLALQSLEVESKSEGPRTHPPAQERINDCLTRYELDNEQLVLAYTAVGLQVLFSGKGISPDIEGPSPAEILSGLLVDISRACHE